VHYFFLKIIESFYSFLFNTLFYYFFFHFGFNLFILIFLKMPAINFKDAFETTSFYSTSSTQPSYVVINCFGSTKATTQTVETLSIIALIFSLVFMCSILVLVCLCVHRFVIKKNTPVISDIKDVRLVFKYC